LGGRLRVGTARPEKCSWNQALFAHKFYFRKCGDGRWKRSPAAINEKGALANVLTPDCRNPHIPIYICFKGVNNTGGVRFSYQGQGAHAIFLISQNFLAML
jgi:hypothetical protein